MRACSGLANEVKDGVAVVGPVSDDITIGRQVTEELRHRTLVVRLPGGEDDPNW
jgi:hypothetical protein